MQNKEKNEKMQYAEEKNAIGRPQKERPRFPSRAQRAREMDQEKKFGNWTKI